MARHRSTRSSHSSKSVDNDKNVKCAPYGKELPKDMIEEVNVEFQVTPGQSCGVTLNRKNMAVIKLEMEGAGVTKIEFGDVLLTLNGESLWKGSKANLNKFQSLYKKLAAKGFTCKITLLRPVNVLPLGTKRLPMDQRQEGFSYKLAVLYRIGKRPLGLQLVPGNNRLYVLNVHEFTCAARCVEEGDAILDADGEKISSSHDAQKIADLTQEKPYVTLLIEQAEGPIQKAQVRQALMAYKGSETEVDPPLAPDVIDICKVQSERLKKRDPKPQKSILKEDEEPRGHVSFEEKASAQAIVAEHNNKLMVPIPAPTPVVNNYQSLAALDKGKN
ncbi:unnamed protein product [Bursaphelenchus okinawaensis]|uniref:PDZ domain-containing protein n=1 Tax=Bursaphelenchus okinawaensis TaxID=465554 RepID=A0A811L4B2_9BILA|nr:unnamed protein product [Bursaphelenchus okinawaensis]CAG9117031.1 unnamed protein product [Bursaphelenchus okinawaensis]